MTTRALIALALLHAAVSAGESKARPFALDSTYEERVKASSRNRPVEVESLVFPQPHASNILPRPVVVAKGRMPVRYPDQDRVIWQRVPKQPAHDEYLAKRGEFLAQKKPAALVEWCVANRLPVCAEFELRAQLVRFKSFTQPGYRPIVDRWRKYAGKRQIDTSFPLPVKGIWYVVPDETGHHRIKAGAAYAFDLVIRRNGKAWRGDMRQLSDHYAWDQPFYAQADGVVQAARDDQPDMPIGKSGGFANANNIVVDYGGGALVLYGHLRKGTAKVKVGDRVKAGQELARVGNSGASGMPHLHFTFLDAAYFSIRGRYRCKMKRAGRVETLDGQDLIEGSYVRNLDGVLSD